MKENSIEMEQFNDYFVHMNCPTLEELETIDKFQNDLIHKISEAIMHDKDLLVCQRIIENQQKEIDEKATIILAGAEKVKKLEKENQELKHRLEGKECVIETQVHNEEVYEKLVEKLQKENEKLKNKLLDTLNGQKVIREETPQYIKENYVSKQKIRDKMKYLDNQQKKWLEDRELKASDSEIIFARDFLQKLLESGK